MKGGATTRLAAYIDGVGLIGPGLPDWSATEAVLTGRAAYAPAPLALPAPTLLPAAERRRVGRVVKLAIALGVEATGRAGLDTATLAAVFSSSGGDGDNCHAICETLATSTRQLSPTRFHNSVHNAAAGYWSIATGSMAASTALCAYDASFAAGLLEALTQLVCNRQPVLLIACDCAYPPPLSATRPMLDGFGMALVLAPSRSARSVAHLVAELAEDPVDRCELPAIESLRLQSPAARGLPLLSRIALRTAGTVVLEYLESLSLRTTVESC